MWRGGGVWRGGVSVEGRSGCGGEEGVWMGGGGVEGRRGHGGEEGVWRGEGSVDGKEEVQVRREHGEECMCRGGGGA